MKTSAFGAVVVAFGVGAFIGCAEHPGESEQEAVGVDIQAIIGGTPATAYPAAAVLNMRAATGGSLGCSATVIAPKVVLTAGHCVDGMVAWDVYLGGSKRSSTHGETFDWNEGGASTVNPNHHDIGLVYLTDALTLPSYPTLAAAPVSDNSKAVNVGRVLNGTVTTSLYSAPVTLLDAQPVGYPFDYYASDVIEHGDSGGPVFAAGTQTILAVNSGAGGTTEVLARVDLLRAWIEQRIAAQGGPAPAPSPTPAPTPTPTPAPTPAPTPTTPATPPDAGAAGACTNEIEPNDSLAGATTLQAAECGTLASKTDIDWFTVTASAGKTTIALTASSDASFTIGFPVNGACSAAVSNTRQVAVSVLSGSTKLCVSVSSSSHTTQTYRLTSTR